MEVLNHIQDVHSHSDPAFPKCEHQSNASKDPSKWFRPGSTALNRIEKVLTNKRCLTDVEKLSHHFQTSIVESFHSVIQCFAPKNVVFPSLECYAGCTLLPCTSMRMPSTHNGRQPRGKKCIDLRVPKGQKGRLHSQTNEDRAKNVLCLQHDATGVGRDHP